MKKALFAIPFLLLIGCKSPTQPTQLPSFDRPTAWIYSIQEFDSSGTQTSLTFDTLRIISVTEAKNKKYYLLNDSTMYVTDASNVLIGYNETDCECEELKMPAT